MTQFTPPIASRFRAVALRDTAAVRLHERRIPQWTVNLNADGAVQSMVPHGKAAKGETPYMALAPREAKARTIAPFPLLITDNAGYVLGVGKDGASDPKAGIKRGLYLAFLERAAHLPDVQAVLTATRTLTPADFPAPVDSTHLITFRVDGRNPHEHPDVQAFWIEHVGGAEAGAHGGDTDALTGERATLTRNGPLIKNVPGGEATVLYQSRNAPAFVNYGLETLGVAQTTLEEVSRGVWLLASDPLTSHAGQGWDFKMLHWLDGAPASADPWLDMQATTQEYVAASMLGETGERQDDDAVTVNLALVRGSVKRLVVLEHRQSSLRQARAAVDRFRRIGGNLPVWQLALTLRNSAGKENPRHVQALYTTALLGGRLPRDIAAPIMHRWLHQHTLSRADAGMLRLSLNFPGGQEPDMQDAQTLPPHLRNAYLLGQYAAHAHFTHRRVSPTISQTVTDRYLRLLASQPASTYGQISQQLNVLIRSYVRSRPQLEPSMRAKLNATSEQLTLPLEPRFTLEQRTALALGYDQTLQQTYNEMQASREAKKARTEDDALTTEGDSR